jgi:STE24 endopeptidase
MSEVSLDPERQLQAKEYARIQRRLMVVDLVFGAVYALAWLVTGWSTALKDFLLMYMRDEWLLVAGFALVFGGIYYLINLPMSYYSGFVLPHRFEMSNQTRKGWVVDQLKGLGIGVILGGLLLEIIYAVLRLSPDWWWLWAAGILLLFSVILANLAPVLLMPLFYKFVPLGEEQADLVERLMRLAERANTRVQGVFKFDMSRRTKAANAALTGLGNTRRILLGDTLIDEFTTDEIETVLVGLYLASLGLNWGVEVFGFAGPEDIAALPLFVLVIGAYGLVTMPLGNAYSRWRERRADEYALRTTGNGAAYASAMTRLANQNLADANPEPWVEVILYSHPALSKRIAMAEAYQAQLGQ